MISKLHRFLRAIKVVKVIRDDCLWHDKFRVLHPVGFLWIVVACIFEIMWTGIQGIPEIWEDLKDSTCLW